MFQYDSTSAESVVSYAKWLLNKSLRDFWVTTSNAKIGKGSLWNIIEEYYFWYKPNSNSEADFKEAGIELKTTPIKKISKGYVSKERLVLNIIDFKEEYKYNSFEESSFWKKNRNILLMAYLHEANKELFDYIFKLIELIDFSQLPEEDLKIIIDDWNKIVGKIKDWEAHNISEWDTVYLGACTKWANKDSLRSQPFSNQLAKQRAFSLKSKYINFIFNSYWLNSSKLDSELIVKDVSEYKKDQTFEEYVIEKFQPYIGKTESKIYGMLWISKSNSKDRLYLLTKSVLGIKKKNIEEFEKAGIILKTITLEKSWTLKESMSFSQIKFKEIVKESWEDSYWYNTLTSRFFFVVFQKNEYNEPVLRKVFFWTMPVSDIDIVQEVWQYTKEKILAWNHDNFIKISDDKICHIRPKWANSKDLMESFDGKMYKKKCYWLNSSYIKNIINSK